MEPHFELVDLPWCVRSSSDNDWAREGLGGCTKGEEMQKQKVVVICIQVG